MELFPKHGKAVKYPIFRYIGVVDYLAAAFGASPFAGRRFDVVAEEITVEVHRFRYEGLKRLQVVQQQV